MRHVVVLVLLMVSSIPAARAQPGATKSDDELLVGVWNKVSIDENDDVSRVVLVFDGKGRKYVYYTSGGQNFSYRAAYKVKDRTVQYESISPVITHKETSKIIKLTEDEYVNEDPMGTRERFERMKDGAKMLDEIKKLYIPAADNGKPVPTGYYTPEPAEMPKDLRAPGPQDEKYPFPYDRAKADRIRAESLKWYTDQILVPYEKYGLKDDPAAEQAKKALTAVVEYYALGKHDMRAMTNRQFAVAKARADGSRDPQTIYYYQQLVNPHPLERSQVLGAQTTAVDAFHAQPYPAYRRAHSAWNLSANLDSLRKIDAEYEAPHGKALDLFWPAFKEVCKDRSVYAERFVAEVGIAMGKSLYDPTGKDPVAGMKKAEEKLKECGASEWSIRLMHGSFGLYYGWSIRGGDTADKVSASQFRQFHAFLEQAETHLTKCWDLDPTRPDGAELIVELSRGLGKDRDEMEKWFRRAMEADPNRYLACAAKMQFLRPAWGGSQEDMIAFGRQCARTRNYESSIPTLLLDAYLTNGYQSLASFQSEIPFLQPGAWADIREAFEPYLTKYPDDVFHRSWYSLGCASCLQFQAADVQLKRMGLNFSQAVFTQKKYWDQLNRCVKAGLEEFANPAGAKK